MAAAELLNIRTSTNRIEFELKGVPVSFANALRRIMLTGIPTVVIKDVQILQNSSQLPHEMLKHRVEMLPINVKASESRIVSETKIELRIPALDAPQEITTRHFTIHGDRKDVLMKDEDGNDLLFLNLKSGEAVHVMARLGIDAVDTSQVSTVSYGFHIDEEQARLDKEEYLADVEEEDKPQSSREFDNFYIQRSFHRDASGQADWYDFFVESWGVLAPAEIVRQAAGLLKARLQEWAKLPLKREGSMNVVESNSETHTIGALVQRVLVDGGKTTRAFYDVPHPLIARMVVKFETTESPEVVLANAVSTIEGWCDAVDAQLSR